MSDFPDADIPDDASDDTTLPLSGKETTILELYDRLLEIEVELALYRARQALSVGKYHDFHSRSNGALTNIIIQMNTPSFHRKTSNKPSRDS